MIAYVPKGYGIFIFKLDTVFLKRKRLVMSRCVWIYSPHVRDQRKPLLNCLTGKWPMLRQGDQISISEHLQQSGKAKNFDK